MARLQSSPCCSFLGDSELKWFLVFNGCVVVKQLPPVFVDAETAAVPPPRIISLEQFCYSKRSEAFLGPITVCFPALYLIIFFFKFFGTWPDPIFVVLAEVFFSPTVARPVVVAL